jgi:hypothetical protein
MGRSLYPRGFRGFEVPGKERDWLPEPKPQQPAERLPIEIVHVTPVVTVTGTRLYDEEKVLPGEPKLVDSNGQKIHFTNATPLTVDVEPGGRIIRSVARADGLQKHLVRVIHPARIEKPAGYYLMDQQARTKTLQFSDGRSVKVTES